LSADDQAAGQGRFAAAPPIRNSAPSAAATPPIAGLRMEDMAAIRQLGDALRDSNKDLKTPENPMSNVAAGEKITPDGQSLTQQVIERELQKGSRKNKGINT
jgi:uncharacterized membrane protein